MQGKLRAKRDNENEKKNNRIYIGLLVIEILVRDALSPAKKMILYVTFS